MNISSNDKVNDFLADLQFTAPDKFDMVISIRNIFLSSNKDLIEEIKYGGLAFNLSNTFIGGIYTYKEHISIEFSNGAEFTDIDSILDGAGKKRRHLKIYTNSDIVHNNSEYFINQACSENY
jgi:hypothetical protein